MRKDVTAGLYGGHYERKVSGITWLARTKNRANVAFRRETDEAARVSALSFLLSEHWRNLNAHARFAESKNEAKPNSSG